MSAPPRPALSRRSLLLGAAAGAAALAVAPSAASASARLPTVPGAPLLGEPPRAPDLWRTLRSPATGESVRLRAADAQALVYDCDLEPGGQPPFESALMRQEKVIEVRDGRLSVLLDGQPRELVAGDTLVVPRGVPHTWRNPGHLGARLRVSWRPGLDGLELFQCTWGLCNDGLVDDKGRPDGLLFAILTSRMDAELRPSGRSAALHRLSRGAMGALLRLPEHRARYARYTGKDPFAGEPA